MIDISSPTWATVKDHCRTIIEQQTEFLVGRSGQPFGDYEKARGEIAAARAILALAEPRLVPKSADYSKRTDRSGY